LTQCIIDIVELGTMHNRHWGTWQGALPCPHNKTRTQAISLYLEATILKNMKFLTN